jgi:hypothetical protein
MTVKTNFNRRNKRPFACASFLRNVSIKIGRDADFSAHCTGMCVARMLDTLRKMRKQAREGMSSLDTFFASKKVSRPPVRERAIKITD